MGLKAIQSGTSHADRRRHVTAMKLMVLVNQPNDVVAKKITQTLNILVEDAWNQIRDVMEDIAKQQDASPLYQAILGVIADTGSQRKTETFRQLKSRIDDLEELIAVTSMIRDDLSLEGKNSSQSERTSSARRLQLRTMELLCIGRPENIVVQPVFTLTLNRIAKGAWSQLDKSVTMLASHGWDEVFAGVLPFMARVHTQGSIEKVSEFKSHLDTVSSIVELVQTVEELTYASSHSAQKHADRLPVGPRPLPTNTQTEIEENRPSLAPIQIRLGRELVFMAELIAEHVPRIRLRVGTDLGFFFPQVHIVDDLHLDTNSIAFRINEVEVSRFEVHPNERLAIAPANEAGTVQGIAVKEPTFGMNALWIDPLSSESAATLGYTIIEPISVITTHLCEQVKRHLDILFTDDDTEAILKKIEDNPPSQVADVRAHIQHQTVTRVFQLLLQEGIPIGASTNIINALALFHANGAGAEELVERVRQASCRLITTLYVGSNGTLKAMTLSEHSQAIFSSYVNQNQGSLSADLKDSIERIKRVSDNIVEDRCLPILLVPKHLRRLVRKLTAPSISELVVVSTAEILKSVRIDSIATI